MFKGGRSPHAALAAQGGLTLPAALPHMIIPCSATLLTRSFAGMLFRSRVGRSIEGHCEFIRNSSGDVMEVWFSFLRCRQPLKLLLRFLFDSHAREGLSQTFVSKKDFRFAFCISFSSDRVLAKALRVSLGWYSGGGPPRTQSSFFDFFFSFWFFSSVILVSLIFQKSG